MARSLRPYLGEIVGDAVFGAHDGLITTFAVISGVSGADLEGRVAIILGVANLLADGVSMAAGNYLGRRSEQQVEDHGAGRGQELVEVLEQRDARIPFVRSGVMGVAFALIGAVPLIPFFFLDAGDAYLMSIVFTLATLFAVGSLRTVATGGRWVVNGLEMLAIGSVAAAIAYGVGAVLGGVA